MIIILQQQNNLAQSDLYKNQKFYTAKKTRTYRQKQISDLELALTISLESVKTFHATENEKTMFLSVICHSYLQKLKNYLTVSSTIPHKTLLKG